MLSEHLVFGPFQTLHQSLRQLDGYDGPWRMKLDFPMPNQIMYCYEVFYRERDKSSARSCWAESRVLVVSGTIDDAFAKFRLAYANTGVPHPNLEHEIIGAKLVGSFDIGHPALQTC